MSSTFISLNMLPNGLTCFDVILETFQFEEYLLEVRILCKCCSYGCDHCFLFIIDLFFFLYNAEVQ